MTWHVIMTKPQKESYAVEKLTEQGFAVYCPQRSHEKMVRHKRVVKHLSLFPRYLFIYHDDIFLAQQHTIRSTPGVAQLIQNGGIATPVHDQIISAIKSLEQLNQDKVEKLYTRNDQVIINNGIYKDMEAIFVREDSEERAVLLIQILHNDAYLTIAKNDFKKI